jgi:predicted nuclease of predicted toxin-antitoxin system
MSDADILRIACDANRLVVTMDKDFGELVCRRGRRCLGVLLLRLDDATGEQKAVVIRDIFDRFGTALPGRLSVYRGGRLRLRPLCGFDTQPERPGNRGEGTSH